MDSLPGEVRDTGRGRRRPYTAESRADIYRQASAIVRAEFSTPITEEDIARRVAASPRQLRRAFSEIGGGGFRSFVTGVRMERAAALLDSTDLAVGEVARRVGYRTPSQFTKAFKRAYGATPSAFRAQARPR